MKLRKLFLKSRMLLANLSILFLLSSHSFAQCPLITKVDTKLVFGEGEKNKPAPLVEAWRYGDLATVVLVPGVNVNPDGSPRAYSVGNKGLVDIQNGVKILDIDPKTKKPAYLDFADYRRIYGVGFTSLWLDAEAKNFDGRTRQFDAFALYSHPTITIVGNGRGRPKTQAVAENSIRYYISMTSTTQGSFPDDSDQGHYLDSGQIPAFVVPRLPKKPKPPKQPKPTDPLTSLLGERQLAWAYYPDTNRSTFAMGGDTGPVAKFGESTIAFQQLLRFGEILPIPNFKADAKYTKCNLNSPPSTWKDCLYPGFVKFGDGGRIKATSLPGKTIFVFFDKDEKITDKTVDNQAIQMKGQVELEKIGKNKLYDCLKQMTELKDLLKNLKGDD